jgi:DNA-binding response OmpR family regulator
MEVKHITLDNARHTVYSNKEELPLTRKEFSLLRYFMKNKGTVLSRGLILEHIWDMDTNPLSNSLEVHVQNLRRKIGDTDHDIIQTISGRGYRMSDKVI